jgi:hypothetical protein
LRARSLSSLSLARSLSIPSSLSCSHSLCAAELWVFFSKPLDSF